MEERSLQGERLSEDGAALRYFLGRAFAFIGDAPDCQIALWQTSFALGTDNCIGHTMSSKAQEIGVTTACISKGATKVCRMLNIPPSPWMLDEHSRRSYRNLRQRQEAERTVYYNQSGHPVYAKSRDRRATGQAA